MTGARAGRWRLTDRGRTLLSSVLFEDFTQGITQVVARLRHAKPRY
jgi:hypothetical protein